MRLPEEFRDFPDAIDCNFGPYRAVTKHIVDGDTFDALIDFGFNEYRYMPIRLLDIDAPESNRAVSKVAGMAAKAYLESLLPHGTPVLLFTQPDPDSFGRYLAIVHVAENTPSINQQMVDAGHAIWRTT